MEIDKLIENIVSNTDIKYDKAHIKAVMLATINYQESSAVPQLVRFDPEKDLWQSAHDLLISYPELLAIKINPQDKAVEENLIREIFNKINDEHKAREIGSGLRRS